METYVTHDRFTSFALSVAVVMGLLTGCATDTDDPSTTEAAKSVTRSVEDGPVHVELTLARTDLTTHDRVRLELTVESDAGVTVRIEDYLTELLDGDRRFEVGASLVNKTEGIPVAQDRLQWRYVYELTCFLPGTYELPGATVSYVVLDSQDGNNSADGETEQTVVTEAISVEVADARTTPLTEAELSEIAIPDPVELRRPVSLTAWGIAAAGLVGLGLLAWALRRRRYGDTLVKIIPAHVWARAQLDALVAENLTAKGQIQEFYYRVSGIVRGYLERRFHVSAPEMTTEEFLVASRNDPRLADTHATSLGAFLTTCDLVKYARHEPSSSEADAAVKAAEDFVELTRIRDDEPETGGATPNFAGGGAR